jgi:hypothetical protein
VRNSKTRQKERPCSTGDPADMRATTIMKEQ